MAPDEFKNLGFADEKQKLDQVPGRTAGATSPSEARNDEGNP